MKETVEKALVSQAKQSLSKEDQKVKKVSDICQGVFTYPNRRLALTEKGHKIIQNLTFGRLKLKKKQKILKIAKDAKIATSKKIQQLENGNKNIEKSLKQLNAALKPKEVTVTLPADLLKSDLETIEILKKRLVFYDAITENASLLKDEIKPLKPEENPKKPKRNPEITQDDSQKIELAKEKKKCELTDNQAAAITLIVAIASAAFYIYSNYF